MPATLTDDMTGEELAVAARDGDPAVFGALVRRYEGRLFNFLLRRVRDHAAAEDLAQEAFVRAWQNIHRYDPRWRFATWLFTIASRLAASRARAERRRRSRERDSQAEPGRSVDRVRPSDGLESRESAAGIWALAERTLNPDQQTMLWLRYAEDLSMREIAAVMGRTEVAIRVSLFRARDALAGSLVPADISAGEARRSGTHEAQPVPAMTRPLAAAAGGVR